MTHRRRSHALLRRYGHSASHTVRIFGRDYAVSIRQGKHPLDQGVVYLLTGKRGAKYATVRNKHHPDKMFLVHSERGFGIPAGFEGVWLSDQSGTLEVIRQ